MPAALAAGHRQPKGADGRTVAAGSDAVQSRGAGSTSAQEDVAALEERAVTASEHWNGPADAVPPWVTSAARSPDQTHSKSACVILNGGWMIEPFALARRRKQPRHEAAWTYRLPGPIGTGLAVMGYSGCRGPKVYHRCTGRRRPVLERVWDPRLPPTGSRRPIRGPPGLAGR